jgi:Fe-S-cluster containining protein
MSEPWYEDGLRFTCTRCGHCCTGEPGFVWVDDDDLAAIAQLRGETLEEVKALYVRWTTRGRTLREKSNGDCVFYDRTQVLGKQRGHAGSLATHLRSLSRLRPGRIDFR